MKKWFAWLDVNFEPIAMVVIFYAIAFLLGLQVILRFVFQTGFSWAEEVSRFMFVWLMYFSFSYATRNQRHIKINMVLDKFKERTQKIIMIFADLLFFMFTIIALKATYGVFQSVKLYGDKAVTVDVSLNVIYAAGLIGFTLMLIRVCQGFVWKIKNFAKPMDYFANQGGIYSGVDKICFERPRSQ